MDTERYSEWTTCVHNFYDLLIFTLILPSYVAYTHSSSTVLDYDRDCSLFHRTIVTRRRRTRRSGRRRGETTENENNAIQSSNWLWRVAFINVISQPFLTIWIAVSCNVSCLLFEAASYPTVLNVTVLGNYRCIKIIHTQNIWKLVFRSF